MQYCLKTNLSILTTEIKQNLLEIARSQWNPEFDFLQINPTLTNSILTNLPEYFKFNLDEIFLRLQIINQTKIHPHADRGRKSGIYIMLTDNPSYTHFYDWKTPEQKTTNGWSDVDQLDLKLSIKFPKDEAWLFNHSAIHSVDFSDSLRVSINILYQYTEYNKLVKIYQRNVANNDYFKSKKI